MKWTYIPLMFALAFVYTKISYNNFQIDGKEKASLILRTPGSLLKSNPNIGTVLKVPTALLNEKLSTEDLKLFNKVAPYEGLIVGNVGVENFGYVIDDNKKVSFSVSDFGEVSKGALFHDVLNHLISSKILDKRISWFDYFEAYKKGIEGEGHESSFYTDRGISDAFLDSETLFYENITIDYPFEFTKLKRTFHHVDAVRNSRIQNELMKIFPKIKFFEILESNAGKTNYQVLARLHPHDKIQWLEIKENRFNKKNEDEKHIELLKMNIYSGNMTKSIYSFYLGEKFFTLKLVENFIVKIKWSEIPINEYRDIVMDEAYVLGKIHSKSLGQKRKEYMQSWATITASSIDEKIINLKYILMDMEKITK